MKLFYFYLITFLASFGWSAAAAASSQHVSNDIENPLSSSSSSRSEYALLAGDEGEVQLAAPVAANRPWTVPRGQFDVGVPIFGTIFGFMTAWGQDDPISLLVRAMYIVSFLVCVQIYFGFYVSVHRRGGDCCLTACLPEFKYNRVDFGTNPLDVSFGRWASGPFSWISEVISFLPDEAYEYLEKTAYFPNRPIVHLVFMVQLLYYFGLYDCYRSNIVPA